MCRCKTKRKVKILRLKIDKTMSHTGYSYYKDVAIDSCISDIVQALENNNIYMLGSCCGHNEDVGSIALQDGRILIITDSKINWIEITN